MRDDAYVGAAAAQVLDHGVVALDADGNVLGWNAGAQRITGIGGEDMTGRSAALLFPPDSRDRLETWLARAGEAGGAAGGEWLMRRDGSRFWAAVSLSPTSRDDDARGFALVFRDATAEKEAEEELRRSHAMFEGILAIASDAVVCVDEAQRIVFFNQGAERIFGYPPAEALGRPLEILIPDRFRSRHAAEVRGFAGSNVAARQMGERGEISGRRKNGEVFPAEASISKLVVGGAPIFTAVLRDVTDRRAAEEALARQAEELARSNRELEQFAYVASHDLQEPLRMVASYTQLLNRRYGDRLDDDAREFIGFAVDGVNRMQALINDLLAFSRVGTRAATPEPVEAEAVLERVLHTLEPAIEEAGARITHDPLPEVVADPVQLGQVLQNLIANAMKFHRPEEAPAVHVGARDEGAWWRFTVQDNGIGIAPEFRDRIFALFQRLHSRAEYPGTGIGLAICQKIVERHGGQIGVESRPGEGSTFHFTLPKRPAAHAEAE